MSVLGAVLSATMIAQTVRMAVPYACAALAGVTSERSGIANIALEGMLLASGLAGVAVHLATGSPVAGVVAAVATGALVALFHALVVVLGGVDAIVSGIALNLVAAGGTRFVLRALYGSSSNSPGVEGFRSLLPADGPWGALSRSLLARTLVDPFVLATLAVAAYVAWSQQRTRFGLRLRACGEDPEAAAVVGIPVDRVRIAAVTLGGAMCGLGGAALAFDQHQFQSGMSGGRGFIALAAVILSGWRPGRAVLACVAFAALDALQIVLQDQAWIPTPLVQMLPYVATLAALVVVSMRGSQSFAPPAGMGKSAS